MADGAQDSLEVALIRRVGVEGVRAALRCLDVIDKCAGDDAILARVQVRSALLEASRRMAALAHQVYGVAIAARPKE
jgi:hypothetical protein